MKPKNPIYRRWIPQVETRLPDIHGCLQDIQMAYEMTSRFTHELSMQDPEIILLDALIKSAIVHYSRCFTTGIRIKISIKDLPTASSEEFELHERISGVRDWYIAHPINEQEVHALYVILDGSHDANTGAIGFSSFSAAEAPLELHEVNAMLELCEKWIRWLSDKLIEEQTPLFPLANLLSRDELLALPQEEPIPNSNIKARRRQAKH